MSPSRPGIPDRNLALELVRVTEAAALASGRWVGRGKKNEGDGAAVDAMRTLINSVQMNGVVVIGEGEKDQAPMLFNGERVGTGEGAEVDIAVGPDAVGCIDITAPVSHNIQAVAKAKGITPSDVTVVVLDRPRHAELIQDVRDSGAKVRLIRDGDVAGAVAAAQDTNSVDIMMGVGGTPEGIIAACAMKCMGGEIQGILAPKDAAEAEKAQAAGHDLGKVLTTDDLVTSNNCFFVATGVTNGDMLRGVSYRANGATTRSLVMRSRSGTIRYIESVHKLAKLQEYALVDYSPKP